MSFAVSSCPAGDGTHLSSHLGKTQLWMQHMQCDSSLPVRTGQLSCSVTEAATAQMSRQQDGASPHCCWEWHSMQAALWLLAAAATLC